MTLHAAPLPPRPIKKADIGSPPWLRRTIATLRWTCRVWVKWSNHLPTDFAEEPLCCKAGALAAPWAEPAQQRSDFPPSQGWQKANGAPGPRGTREFNTERAPDLYL